MASFQRIYLKNTLPVINTTVTEDTTISSSQVTSVTINNKATTGLYNMINNTAFGNPITVEINVASCYSIHDGTTLLAAPYNAGTTYSVTSGTLNLVGLDPYSGTVGYGNIVKDGADIFYVYSSGGRIGGSYSCLIKGTKITMADYSVKNIEDITEDDLLLVWDFDLGILGAAYPIWIKKEETADQYLEWKFSDGTILEAVGEYPNAHRIYNIEKNKFTYPNALDTPLGTHTLKSNLKQVSLISTRWINKQVKYYNIITKRHLNLFANGILTSCSLSNMYPIQKMKYIKDNRSLISREYFLDISDLEYTGLRLAEQPVQTEQQLKELQDYVTNKIRLKKK